MFETLDQLIGPLTLRIMELLGQPVTGTDDQTQHNDTKRGFFGLLNAIIAAKLQPVFLSPRNKAQLEPLLTAVQRLTLDTTDPAAQRAALTFFGRCVTVWAAVDSVGAAPSDEGAMAGGALPGFEQFVYNSLVPGVFELIKLPAVNPKDGQMMLVNPSSWCV
jgi:exportin-T